MQIKSLVVAGAALLSLASPAMAHFVWLTTNEAGHAVLFFGESLAERDYHLPEAVEKAEVQFMISGEETTVVTMPVVEEEGFTGRRSAVPLQAGGILRTVASYGVYHGTKLTYYVQSGLTVPGVEHRVSEGLEAIVSKTTEGGIEATILWGGKPLPEVEVKLFDKAGQEQAADATDDGGVVRFAVDTVKPGLNGLMLNYVEADATGEIDGKEFTSATHYLTATFRMPASDNAEPSDTSAALPSLPEPIASFGGAVCDGWLYVYSGHTGTAHEHSRENLSQHFCRLQLEGGTDWEALPCDAPLQGLPLVAHGGMVYRVGGLDAHNAAEEDEDLHSTDRFARFDPATKQWEELQPLPERRSSHDAVVIGDKLYVVGGWTLAGDSSGEWLDSAWVCDLTNTDAGWQAIPSPPFLRRALAVTHLDGKLVVIGGMGSEGGVSRRVDAFDLATGEWTQLADFPAKGFAAFGVSAWNLDGAVYASASEGVLQRLTSVDGDWEQAGELETPRFFHRLLPGGQGQLLAIGGASMEDGHLATTEVLTP